MRLRRILLRCVAAFLFYMALCYLYLYTLTPADLLSTTGKVTQLKIILIQGKYNHRPMMIDLDNFSHEFRLMDVYKGHFDYIKNSIGINDVVKIYYRTPTQSFIGLGKRYDIYQIEKNGHIIFSF